MIDRLEASTKSIQDFSSDISHELKTPLAIIRGEVDLALRKSRTPEELIKTLQTVGEEVNELIRLVDDLMLLVRSDSRQLRFEKKRISLKEIINLMASRYQDRAASRGLTIRTDIAADLFIQGDDIYIKRLFSNLIDNAIKFTPTGGMIDLELKKFGNRAVAGVKDTGIGIELDIQAKVFSRFFRSDSARSHEGAGLGLNIAKAICSGHSAEISIVSAPYKGTLVSVSFPILS